MIRHYLQIDIILVFPYNMFEQYGVVSLKLYTHFDAYFKVQLDKDLQ
jgi:hypothetical protein